jgi:hypothetical protein
MKPTRHDIPIVPVTSDEQPKHESIDPEEVISLISTSALYPDTEEAGLVMIDEQSTNVGETTATVDTTETAQENQKGSAEETLQRQDPIAEVHLPQSSVEASTAQDSAPFLNPASSVSESGKHMDEQSTAEPPQIVAKSNETMEHSDHLTHQVDLVDLPSSVSTDQSLTTVSSKVDNSILSNLHGSANSPHIVSRYKCQRHPRFSILAIRKGS